ncbi:fungal hydrophobin [Coprinellus micaceus]|uniref:Hydrophobin n=1 Tax=Coprinellus micaceus TaxID=71717 RepID=A0A4Y7TJK5_COPMI|nr:fungal hydrophobin [Coprinellus micaceus]
MQFTSSLIAVSALVTSAAASGTPPAPIPPSQCNTGPIQCCQSTGFVDEPAVSNVLSLLGIVVQDLNVFAALTCSPISVIGLPGNSCSAQPVCCTNNTFNGLISLGCTPININL